MSIKSNFDISNPIYFNKESENYAIFKRIIIEQGQLSCRNQIDLSYIQYSLERFTDGYIYLDLKDMTGKIVRLKSDMYVLKSYSLLMDDGYFSLITALITCGHVNYPGSTNQVLNSVFNFIQQFKIRTCILYCLPFEKLIEYYKRFGFDELYTKNMSRGNKKVIVMRQHFDYTTENQIDECDTITLK